MKIDKEWVKENLKNSKITLPEGAIEIDTSLMGVEETIEEILGLFKWK